MQAKCKLLTDTLKSKKEMSCHLGWSKCLPFQFPSCDDQFYRYIRVNFTFGPLDRVHYIRDIVILWIVKSGFCSIHLTVTLAGLKNVNRYIVNIIISKIVMPEFHCVQISVFVTFAINEESKALCNL